MMDLPLFSRQEKNEPELPKHLTVSELTTRIRGVLEPAFVQVWVVGEVSNYRPAASGHVYFSLKDQNSCISAAAFGWNSRGGAGTKRKGQEVSELKDGLKVLCRGKVTIYGPRGSYQLIVDQIEALGAGALQVAFEKLKAKLAAEGLFHPDFKRELPPLPMRIAVITSPSGAAIQDMLQILKRRAPQIHVTVVPALVQGEEAPAQIIKGIELANRFQLGELIVLARGGGSIEDLWCFNHEELARVIRKSDIPIISAVGHEIDFTIADFVADLRAPTPSAAAEILSGNWVAATSRVTEVRSRLLQLIQQSLNTKKNLLTHIAARVVSPKDRLREQVQRVDELSLRLQRAWKTGLDRKRTGIEKAVGKLDALSPLRVLERGYTLVRDPDGNGSVVKSVEQVRLGQELQITFYDGQRRVRAI